MHIATWIAIVTLCCASACKRRGYCAEDLSGTWTNPRDEAAQYVFEDHGDTVTLRASGGGADRPDAFRGTAALQRTESALRGVLRTTLRAPSGKECSVEIPFDVTSCRSNDIVLHRREDAAVGEDCAPRSAGSPRVVEFTVYRVKAAR